MSDGGKGSSPRPYSVSQEKFSNNWDTIFGKNKKVQTDSEVDKVERNNEETQEVKLHSGSKD
jgi:hypothetical protein